MYKRASFEEMKKTWRDKKALLECYAKSLDGKIIEGCTNDGWDITVQLSAPFKQPFLPKGVLYTAVGPNYPEVYEELLTIVMRSNEWNAIEEMKVWIDLNVNDC